MMIKGIKTTININLYINTEHFDDILEILHKQSLPLDQGTILVFKALAADPKLQKSY